MSETKHQFLGCCTLIILSGTSDRGLPVVTDIGYSSVDTVGCGVDLTTRKIWFTRNGIKLEYTFDNVQGRLFPLLGLIDDVHLETNFTGPFLWKGDDLETEGVAPEHKDLVGQGKA